MPTLAERFFAAVRTAVGIFSPTTPRDHGLLRGLWPGGYGATPTPGARERVESYADFPWVFALADKVAYAFATVDWHVYVVRRKSPGAKAHRDPVLQSAAAPLRRAKMEAYRGRGELVEILSHPLLDAMRNGNSLMTGLAVRKVTALHFDLEGETFWMKERDALGVPVAFWPLPPDWIRATPTATNPSYLVSFRSWRGTIPDTEIAWLTNPNPSNPYGRGTGVVRALADELETDEMAARSVRQTFFNQARPDFVVYPDEDGAEWSESQRQRLALDWQQQHEGFWRVAKARIASRKIGVHEFSSVDHRKLEMTKLREFERDLVRQTWGVPPEIMGIVEPGASRATITRADYVFSKWVVEPRLEMFRALLQHKVVPEYDERIVIDYDSPIQDDKEFALEVGKAAPFSLTVDEWRAMGQHEGLGAGGELHALPTNYSFGPMEEREAKPPTPAPQQGGGDAPPAPKARRVRIERGPDGLVRSAVVEEE